MDAPIVDTVVGTPWLWWLAVAAATLVQLTLLVAVWRLRPSSSRWHHGVLPRDRHPRRRDRQPAQRSGLAP
jgi:hypothetical protein